MTCVNSKYTIINGTSYHAGTSFDLIQVLERLRERRQFAYITYLWGDEKEIVRCTVGRSTGTIKIPLEIKTSRSYGGGAMSDDRIIEVRALKKDGGRILWREA